MDLYFFLKSLILAVVFVLILQIKIGNHTLEDRAVMMFKSPMVEEPLRGVAKGGVKLIKNLLSWSSQSF